MGKRLLITSVNAHNWPSLFENYGSNFTIKIDINVEPDQITYTLKYAGDTAVNGINYSNPAETIRTYNEYVIESYILPLSSIKTDLFGKTIKSNTLVAPVIPVADAGVISIDAQETLDAGFITNLSALTYNQRVFSPYSNRHLKNPDWKHFPLMIFVKDPNGTFEDHDIIIASNTKGNVTVTSNETFTNYDKRMSIEDFVDSITISKDNSYSDTNYTKYSVNAPVYLDSVYLNQVTGILDRSEVTLTSGTGSFRVLKDSVELSENVSVKAGFKYYPDIIQFTDQ